ncbi:MAG: Uma2 family endonuclease [Planctomycetia bacterium]|nr:Uma2 family endonuclease [Planctomycetia bacterium]
MIEARTTMSTGIARRWGGLTFDDFMSQVGEDQKAELLDGVIHVASPENFDHNDLESWLGCLLKLFAAKRKLGKVNMGKVAFRLKEGRGVEPDVSFISKRRLSIIRGGYADGPPDLAVEIVSPESVRRDYVLKRRYYEEAGVREYWIIDPLEKSATFLGLVRGVFRELPVTNNVFCSRVVPGFSLDVRWLWRPEPPDIDKAFTEIKKRARGKR